MTGTFSGRNITTEDMALIKWAIESYPNLSRYELAGTVCELIGWLTPSGRSRIPQCMAFFAHMEAEGVLSLPAIRPQRPATIRYEPAGHCTATDFSDEITSVGDIELCIARPGNELKKWRGYIQAFHPIGDKMVFGSRLHYFIRSESRDLGCLQFSAAAWALEYRDKWIGWSEEDRKSRLFLVVNNSRFLLLPYVRVKNLASRVLSLAVKQIKSDWVSEFGYKPVLLETFVDTTAYKATIYRAANWIYLGHTKGRGRMDRNHNTSLSRKAIYVYPMRPDFADVLIGKKPYELVSPL